MSNLALQLIAENKAKHERGEDASYLDLGNCGLTELPAAIGALTWLETLILSSEWWEYDLEKMNGAWRKSQNTGKKKQLTIYCRCRKTKGPQKISGGKRI